MMRSNPIEQWARHVAAFSVTRPWLVAVTLLVICAALSSGAANMRFAGDYRVFFGPDNPDFVANQDAQATFGKPDNVAFVIIPRSGDVFTPDTLETVAELTELAWQLPYVSRVDSLTNFQDTKGVEDDLIVENFIDDPQSLTADDLDTLKARAASEPLLSGFVVARNNGATIVNATIQVPTDIPSVSSAIIVKARDLKDQVLATHPDHEIHLTGVVALSAGFEEAGLKDSSTLTPLVYLFILVVMALFLRSASAVFASLMVILLSTLAGMGVGGLTGVELTPISLSAPTIILTIAVADAIHIIASIRAKMRKGMIKSEAIIAGTALNFAPVAITSITTVIGFLTLNFSDSPPFHHLGNISAAGIAAAWVLSVTFLPALLSLLPLKFTGGIHEDAAPSRMELFAERIIAAPRTALLVTLGLALSATAFIPTIETNDQWSQYFDESLEIRRAINAADPYFGSDPIEFVIDPGAPGGVTSPDFLRTLDAFTAWLRTRDDVVAHVFSLGDIMKRLTRNLNGDDPAFYRIPDDQAVASQFLLVYELSLPYGLDLNNRVDIDRRATRVTATMKDISTGQTKAFIRDAKAWFGENGGGWALDITGSKVLFSYVAQRNIEAVFEGALYLIVAIFLILSLTFRSLSVGLLSLVPNALPLAATFGIWALLVGVVGFSVAAVAAVAVGLIIDFTVHFLSKYFRARQIDGRSPEEAIRYAFSTAGSAILLTTLILAAGFAVLVTSSFKLNADMGLLTALAIITAMLTNLILLPAMLLLAARRQQSRAATPAIEGETA